MFFQQNPELMAIYLVNVNTSVRKLNTLRYTNYNLSLKIFYCVLLD